MGSIYLQLDVVLNILARDWKTSHLVFPLTQIYSAFFVCLFVFVYSERDDVSRVRPDLEGPW